MRARLFSSLAAISLSAGSAIAQSPEQVMTPAALPECVCPTQLPDSPSKYLPEPCGTCACECAPPRWWGGVDYLLWFAKDMPLNAAVFTQGPAAFVNGLPPGAIGNPNTRILYGANAIDFGSFNGIRTELGYWFNPARTLGVQGRGFVLERGGEFFQATAPAGDPLELFRPVRTESPGFAAETSLELSGAFVSGTAYASTSTHLWGFDTDAVWNVRDRSCYRFDATFGFRYLDLRETLTIGSVSTVGVGPAAPFAEFVDTFGTRNQFYGPQVGGKLTLNYGRIDIITTAKLALGVTHEVEDNAGFIRSNLPGFQAPGVGFLVGTNNDGTQERDRFAAVPEIGVKAAYRVTENVSATMGYEFLYVSNVVRPGDQVDRVFAFDAAGTQVRPANTVVPGDYFAHGFTLGVGFTY